MAIRTVGYSKTYSTVVAAIAAASAGDTIEIYWKDAAGASRLYYENLFSNGKASMTLQGMSPGVGFIYGQGIFFWDVGTNDYLVCNDIEVHGFAEIIYTTAYGKHFQFHRCKFYGQRYGFFMLNIAHSFSNDNNPPAEIISCFFADPCITDITKYAILIPNGFQGGAGACNMKIYNNTIIGACNGITVVAQANAAVDIKNNLVLVAGTCYGGVASSCTFSNNGSADATGSAGLQNLTRASCKFASLGGSSYDYKVPHVMSDGAAAGVGADLSGYFAYDIDNIALAAPFPIGCSKARAYPEPSTAVVIDDGNDWVGILGVTKEAAFDLTAYEAGRNNDNGTVAADIATGKSVKIRDVTIDGESDKLYSAAEEAVRNIDPTEPKVEIGTAYKILNVAKTGSKPNSVVPATPTFTVANDGTGTSFTSTIDGDAGVTNYIEYKKATDSDWTAGGNRSGDGAIQVTGLVAGFYQVRCFSKSGDSYSAAEVIASIHVDDGATAYIVQVMEAVRDAINTAALTDSGGDAIMAEIEIPPQFEDVKTSVIKVFPDQQQTDATHMQANKATYMVNVAVCERAKTEAARNKNMRNDEILKDMFVGKRLSLLTDACCISSSSPNIAEMSQLWEQFNWISVVQLEFPRLRARL